MKIAWVCDECNWLQVSDSKEHHKMDVCRCDKTGVDFEEYHSRFYGSPRLLAELKEGNKWKVVTKKVKK